MKSNIYANDRRSKLKRENGKKDGKSRALKWDEKKKRKKIDDPRDRKSKFVYTALGVHVTHSPYI